MAPKPKTLAERFWSKVDKTDGCWNWTATTDEFGYGHIGVKTDRWRLVPAHRVSWELHHGESIPDGHSIMHLCDNTSCVRPSHLKNGTPADNSRDMVEKDRQAKGACNGQSKLSDESVRQIRLATDRQKDIAARFGVTQTLVSMIKRQKIWRHVK